MIDIKTQEEISIMEKSGTQLGAILHNLLAYATPGIILHDIDTRAERLIRKSGGGPSFQTVEGYRWTTCLCVEDAVVHGIPNEYALRDGDILTIDVGMFKDGFHTDTAWSIEVGHNDTHHNRNDICKKREKFLETGKTALTKAIRLAVAGNRVGHISKSIQETIEASGYSIVRALVGHGVGRTLHEEPQIPGFLNGRVEDTTVLTPGMTIAIEVIYAQGKGSIVYDDDGWTIRTRDGSTSAVFEKSIAVTLNSPIVLTPLPE